MNPTLITCAVVACLHSSAALAQSADINLYAAGSLRAVLTEVSKNYTGKTGHAVAGTFGPSGLLRERIEKGEPAEVFASANTSHPAQLAKGGGWSEPVVFTRNNLCALTQPGITADTATLLDALLDPAVRLGASTPKADPSGDYTWALFEKAEKVRAGAFAALDAKTLKLTGGPDSAKPPEGRNPYAWVMGENKADIFLTYCTNAVAAQKEIPALRIVQVPAELSVGAAYGMTVRTDATPAAKALAEYILSPEAQEVFKRHGFGAI